MTRNSLSSNPKRYAFRETLASLQVNEHVWLEGSKDECLAWQKQTTNPSIYLPGTRHFRYRTKIYGAIPSNPRDKSPLIHLIRIERYE